MGIPSVKEIRDRILTELKSRFYPTESGITMSSRSGWVVIATAFAATIRSGYEYARYQKRQIFTATADISSLITKGEQIGIYQKKGSSTQIQVSFAGEVGTYISKSTQITASSFIYLIDETTDADDDGIILATATATTTGDSTALAIDTEVKLVTPIKSVSSTGTITEILILGSDAETTEEYRARIAAYEKSRPQGGAVPDFISWACEVDGISNAFVKTPYTDNRLVTIYPLTSDSGDERIPSDEKIAEVLAYVSDTVRCPPCEVAVSKWEIIPIDVTVTNLVPSTEELKATIIAAWETMCNEKIPMQYDNEATSSDLIATSSFVNAAMTAGAKACEVPTISITGGRSIPYNLAIGELYKLGTVTWNS